MEQKKQNVVKRKHEVIANHKEKKTPLSRKKKHSNKQDSIDAKPAEGSLYEVDRVLNFARAGDEGPLSRQQTGEKRLWYYIKWKGYSHDDNTWEPQENIPRYMQLMYHENLKRDAESTNAKAPKTASTQRSPQAKSKFRITRDGITQVSGTLNPCQITFSSTSASSSPTVSCSSDSLQPVGNLSKMLHMDDITLSDRINDSINDELPSLSNCMDDGLSSLGVYGHNNGNGLHSNSLDKDLLCEEDMNFDLHTNGVHIDINDDDDDGDEWDAYVPDATTSSNPSAANHSSAISSSSSSSSSSAAIPCRANNSNIMGVQSISQTALSIGRSLISKPNTPAFKSKSRGSTKEMRKNMLTDTIDEEEEEFVVKSILDIRFNRFSLRYEYLIEWTGYDELTWEIAENTECKALIKEFHEVFTEYVANVIIDVQEDPTLQLFRSLEQEQLGQIFMPLATATPELEIQAFGITMLQDKYKLPQQELEDCDADITALYNKTITTISIHGLEDKMKRGFVEFKPRQHGRFDLALSPNDFPTLVSVGAPWMPCVKNILGDDAVLVHSGCIISLPNSVHQNWHSDGPHLDEIRHLPPHALNVFIPLIDLTLQNGPTEFIIGTHVQFNYDVQIKSSILLAKAGQPIIFDYRLKHRGLANNSTRPRKLIYLTYSKPYWYDIYNFSGKGKSYKPLPPLVDIDQTRGQRLFARQQRMLQTQQNGGKKKKRTKNEKKEETNQEEQKSND